MKIKICGLKRKEDIDYVNLAMPDWIGFVFAGTKRRIDGTTAKRLKRELDPRIKAVGVFVNEEAQIIVNLVTEGIVDIIQLHGDEDEHYIVKLKKMLSEEGKDNIPIIKAVRVRTKEQILEAEKLSVDFLLLDAFVKDEYGGSGTVFNHKLIPDLKKPFILAGGITEKNVKEILETLYKEGKIVDCVDVSSSLEVNGYKEKDKIQRMVAVVHGIENVEKEK